MARTILQTISYIILACICIDCLSLYFIVVLKFIPTVFNVLETMLIPEISQFLGLCDLNRMWDIMGTCGLSGDGLYEAIKALVHMIIIHQREIE